MYININCLIKVSHRAKSTLLLVLYICLVGCHNFINSTLDVSVELAQEIRIPEGFDKMCVRNALDRVIGIDSVESIPYEQRFDDVYRYRLKNSTIDRYVGYESVHKGKNYLVHYSLFKNNLTNDERVKQKEIMNNISKIINDSCGVFLSEFNDDISIIKRIEKYKKEK